MNKLTDVTFDDDERRAPRQVSKLPKATKLDRVLEQDRCFEYALEELNQEELRRTNRCWCF